MKKIVLLMTLSFAGIALCMVYLVKSGISLRSAPLISPSVMSDDFHNVSDSVMNRLFPDFQTARYVVLGFLPETPVSKALLERLEAAYEKTFGMKPRIFRDAAAVTVEELRSCETSCWIVTEAAKANELTPNELIDTKIKPLGRAYFTLTWIPFTQDQTVSDFCLNEKRLTFDCLVPLSVHGAQKKMKDKTKRYFFLRKYNEGDHFLFTQETLP